jgi:hypothetical protein
MTLPLGMVNTSSSACLPATAATSSVATNRGIGTIDDLHRGLNQAVECLARKSPDLAQRAEAQFGPVGHRRSLIAATRSAQSGIASVIGTVVDVPARMAASPS